MIRKSNRINALTAAAAVVALAVPASASADVDLRSPDSKAAAIEAKQGQVDLRNPDSRTPPAQSEPRSYVDLRSPDAKAAGQQAETYVDLRSPDSKAPGTPATPSSPQVAEVRDSSWGDVAIGAGAVIGLLLIGGSAMLVVSRRRHGVTA